jgi:hypothetical protein
MKHTLGARLRERINTKAPLSRLFEVFYSLLNNYVVRKTFSRTFWSLDGQRECNAQTTQDREKHGQSYFVPLGQRLTPVIGSIPCARSDP